MFRERNEQYQQELDALIEAEYQLYKEGKRRALIGSGNKKPERALKENVRGNSPEPVTFGRIKQMGQSEEQLAYLLKKLGCRSYEEACDKVQQVNQADSFLGRVKEMTKKAAPGDEPTLAASWRLIK
jgi:hypothetical protein